MKKRLWAVLAAVALLLTGCGGSAKSDSLYQTSVEETWAAAGEIVDNNGISGSQMDSDPSQGRKWIVTIDLAAETEDMDALLSQVQQKTAELGGYVENQDIYNGSAYASQRYRRAELTLRIPEDRAENFVTEVEGQSNVTSHSKSVEDVTLRYVATESRINALKIEEERLLALMEQAQDLSDLLEIESRLTDVRYELENISSQLRLMQNQVDYATIYLSVSEVRQFTSVAERTFWQRISDGFRRNLKGLLEAAEDFVVWLLSSLPTLMVLAVLIAVVVIVCRRISKRCREKRRAKWMAMQNAQDPDRDPKQE